MNIVAKKVKHKTLGIGRVTKIVDNRIFVRFENGNTLSFKYPEDMLNVLFFVNPIDNEDFSNEFKLNQKEESITDDKEFPKNNTIRFLDFASEDESNSLSQSDINKLKRLIKKEYSDLDVIHRYLTLDSFCGYYYDELYREIKFLKKTGGKHFQLKDGTLIAKIGTQCLYAFESDSELNFLPETTIIIYKDKKRLCQGIVVFCEENTIVFICEELEKDLLSFLEISPESWILLEALQKSLLRLKETGGNEIVQKLIAGPDEDEKNSEELLVGQDAAIEHTISNPLTFIWGPPGTGKTTTLTKMAIKLIKEGKRVLMLSQSNVSVDGVIIKLSEMFPGYIEQNIGSIVRYGYPRSKKLLYDNNITTKQLALKYHPELKAEQEKLLSSKKKLSRKSYEYSKINNRLTDIDKALKECEGEIVLKSDFVATTISKAVIDKYIYTQQFDAVIIDEVSMAFTPQVVFAASLAKSNFCCMGDFCQLPAIVQNPNDSSMLKHDIFTYYGIPYETFSNLVMLNTQYRMHPEIASFVSDNMYFGLLKSHKSTINRSEISSSLPYKNQALALFDTSNLHTKCLTTNDGSHYNILSALICAKMVAERITGKQTIGVITPYSTQAKLINSIIKEIIPENFLDLISCNTVHQFQGSEKDIIIYDSVDAYIQKYPGALLVSGKSNEANRLFNVAITRARGKFITIADTDYLKQRLNNSLLFKKYLLKLVAYNSRVDVEHDDNFISCNGSELKTFIGSEKAMTQYEKDIRNSKGKIIVDLPIELCHSKVLNSKFYSLAEEYGASNPVKRKMIIRAGNKRKLHARLNPLAIGCYNIHNPITIIDKHTIWYGNPYGKTSVENQLYWRLESSNVASLLYNLLDIN